MKYLLVRHAQTDANRLTRASFGKRGAPLNKIGVESAKLLYDKLKKLGIDPSHEPVAVSELIRTRQTAEYAGFKQIVAYKLINEVGSTNPYKTQELISKGVIPDEAIESAKNILLNPPNERVWVTHGLIIAAIMNELAVSNPDKLIVDFCEITQISL